MKIRFITLDILLVFVLSFTTIEAISAPVDLSVTGNVVEVNDPDGLLTGMLGLSLTVGESFQARYLTDDSISVTPSSGALPPDGEAPIPASTYAFSGLTTSLYLGFEAGESVGINTLPGIADSRNFVQIVNDIDFSNSGFVFDFWQIGETIGDWNATSGTLLNYTIFFTDLDLNRVDASQSYFMNTDIAGWDGWGFTINQFNVNNDGSVQMVRTIAQGFGSVSTVPVPAAVWLFSSGLIGLIGFARYKKA